MKELKKYTRELLKDHEELKALAAQRQADLERLQEEASEKASAAPNSSLYEELCAVRERAEAKEMEAKRLGLKLAVAEDLRAVDVARARAASSRALLCRNQISGAPRDAMSSP